MGLILFKCRFAWKLFRVLNLGERLWQISSTTFFTPKAISKCSGDVKDLEQENFPVVSVLEYGYKCFCKETLLRTDWTWHIRARFTRNLW